MGEIVAIEIEARLLRWGDSSTAGRTITLELDPDAGERHPFRDYVSGAKNGQRFRLLFAPIGDDEELLAVPPGAMQAPARSLIPNPPNVSPAPPESVPLPVKNGDASERGRQAYLNADEMERARTRAALLCKDVSFWEWSGRPDEVAAAEWLKTAIGAASRRHIGTDPEICRKFLALETDFRFKEQIR